MALEIPHFKTKLTEEKAALETELSRVARINPENPHDWELKPVGEGEIEFHDEVPEFLEEEEEREATEAELEARLRSVIHALDRIEAGTFGICEIGGEPIETERLEANPAARTCKKHLAENDSLV